mmetsp:Transcript_15039/g.22162  ORF Transcript_15039/g.22162 Transcript_15039/m.22162 type:complete len:88 (-) Transcript_15039:164-427(-)
MPWSKSTSKHLTVKKYETIWILQGCYFKRRMFLLSQVRLLEHPIFFVWFTVLQLKYWVMRFIELLTFVPSIVKSKNFPGSTHIEREQ